MRVGQEVVCVKSWIDEGIIGCVKGKHYTILAFEECPCGRVGVDIGLKHPGSLGIWECLVCGYVYDPQLGDSDGGIEPGTVFENLPDDWLCPVCGAPKDQFEKVE